MSTVSHRDNESGMALVTTLMVLMLMSALMVGFFAAIATDQRANGIDRDQTQAYAAAHAGLEKLTSDLAQLFETDFSPTAVQVNALATSSPSVPGFQYTAPGGSPGSGYTVTFVTNAQGNPAPADPAGTNISSGPYQGFRGIITPYTITVTAKSNGGGAEVRLRRQLETVSVPVFQFGIFSESDLSFFAGPDFNFGGRVHTNGNLWLAEGAGQTLTLADRVTAVGEVIRRELSNGFSTRVNAAYNGTVRAITAPSVFRNLALGEGSVADGMGPPISGYAYAVNEPTWTNLSVGTYKSNIRSGRTGGKRLSLPLVSFGATSIDLIKRPAQNSNESVANPLVYGQRYYSQASLRILLSDTAADITSLPLISATAPVPLDGTATVAQYGPINATRPPFATSPGPLAAPLITNGITANGSATIAVTGLISPFFRVQIVRVNGLPAAGVLCTGRTLTTFIGCAAGLPAAANGSLVTSFANAGAGTIAVSTPLTVAIAANANTMTVTSTATFAPGLFWANLAAPASPLPITCTGNNIAQTQFTGCTGITVNIPGGTPISTNALSNAGTNLQTGFIKIELQNVAGAWIDVTTEILNLGIAGRDQLSAACAEPNLNAVIRLQRLRDNTNANCYYLNSLNSNDYWPNALYDPREGNVRDAFAVTNDTVTPGGAMSFVELDTANLKRWLLGTIGVSGTQAVNQNGYIVYFSDRRNNRNTGVVVPAVETGEYGFEDVVNPADINGVPNGGLQLGEDLNGDGIFDSYGQWPVNVPPVGSAVLPLTAAARSWDTVVGGVTVTGPQLMVNRSIFFRRALKLINGGIAGGVVNIPAPGLTVASENAVYVQGNYNATAASANANPHVACAILSDSVTLLSNGWRDINSFLWPNDPGQRNSGGNTGYRMAIASGKTLSFQRPVWNGAANDFGTDGGVHNFLRYIENWGGTTLNYRGSIVSLFTSRQAVGTYKCCANVYGPPTRAYTFDSDFLSPTLLPPGTPMFRDVDTLTFRQLLRPTE